MTIGYILILKQKYYDKTRYCWEHPHNDSNAIKRLIERQYESRQDLHIKVAIKNIRGSQLDKKGKPSRKVIKLLKREFQDKKFNFVIYVRDLDGLPSQKDKITERETWFRLLDEEAANGDGLFFLAIYQLESVVLADIDTFNEIYKVKLTCNTHPMWKENPKKYLKNGTKKVKYKYEEAHMTEIFENLNIEKARLKHKGLKSLNEFFQKLDEKI